jgi:hypothetical protein
MSVEALFTLLMNEWLYGPKSTDAEFLEYLNNNWFMPTAEEVAEMYKDASTVQPFNSVENEEEVEDLIEPLKIKEMPDDMMLEYLLSGYSLPMLLHSDISWRSMCNRSINTSEFQYYYVSHKDLYLDVHASEDDTYLYESFSH